MVLLNSFICLFASFVCTTIISVIKIAKQQNNDHFHFMRFLPTNFYFNFSFHISFETVKITSFRTYFDVFLCWFSLFLFLWNFGSDFPIMTYEIKRKTEIIIARRAKKKESNMNCYEWMKEKNARIDYYIYLFTKRNKIFCFYKLCLSITILFLFIFSNCVI